MSVGGRPETGVGESGKLFKISGWTSIGRRPGITEYPHKAETQLLAPEVAIV